MKLKLLPLFLGLSVGISCILLWHGVNSPNTLHQRKIDPSSTSQNVSRETQTKSKRSYTKIKVGVSDINSVNAETLKKYPNLKRLFLLDQQKQNKRLNITIPLVNSSGSLNQNFKELFDLTDEQVSEIEDKIYNLRKQMTFDIMSQAHVVQGNHKILVEIPPSENAIDYYDRFMDIMQNYLGPERFPAFFHFESGQFSSLFNDYGAEKLNITFEYSGNNISDANGEMGSLINGFSGIEV